MIVVAPRVTRNPTSNLAVLSGDCGFRGKRMLGVVVKQANDDAAHRWHGCSRICAAGIGEILHFSGKSSFEPIPNVFEFWEFLGTHHAAPVETEAFRLMHNP